MSKIECAYFEAMGEYGVYLKPLNPTGRWMIASGPYYEDMMFIEHKGWLLKSWKSEGIIKFRTKETRQIFTCNQPV